MSPGFQVAWLEDSTVPAKSMPAIIGKRRTTGAFAGDGEAVFVVERGIFDADGDVTVHQIGFVEISERGLGAAIRLLDDDCLECRHARLAG